jgi:queuine/archaeosine tRNA-ribosyltransferase
MRGVRSSIEQGRFMEFKKEVLGKRQNNDA